MTGKGKVLLEVRRLRPSKLHIINGILLAAIVLVGVVGKFSDLSFFKIFLFLGLAFFIIISLFVRSFADYSEPEIVIYDNGVEAKQLSWFDSSFLFWSEIRSINIRHYARGGSIIAFMPFKSESYRQKARFRDIDIQALIFHKTPLSLRVPPKWSKHYDLSLIHI